MLKLYRFASGIMILATTEDGTSKILRSIQLAKNRECTIHSYIAVTVGHLPVKKHETKFAMKIVKEGDGDISTVLEKWSKNAVKQNKVKTVIWEHEVISESKLASLVKVNISNTHKNSLKLYLATKCFSPVLGDQIFGSRVANVFGVNLPVHPSNNVKATEV